MKTAANREIDVLWNGTTVLRGVCSTVMGCQIIRSMADEFAGESQKRAIELAEILSARLLNDQGSSATFEFSDETGSAMVIVR